jgi:hypothetical protein
MTILVLETPYTKKHCPDLIGQEAVTLEEMGGFVIIERIADDFIYLSKDDFIKVEKQPFQSEMYKLGFEMGGKKWYDQPARTYCTSLIAEDIAEFVRGFEERKRIKFGKNGNIPNPWEGAA